MKIGVALPMAESKAGPAPRYAEVRDYALQAEAAGFDSVWVFDHLLFRFPDQPTMGIWEAWTILTAIAEATERVEIGALVLCTAFRNPAVLAKMVDTLDEVSGGRLILGLGAGWHDPEFEAFGLANDRLVSRFEEALSIISPLLRTGEVDFAGEFSSATACVSRPRGPRPTGPPILVASFGPRMLKLTARFADAWNTAWLATPEPLAQRRTGLEEACRAEGRDPAEIEITVGVNVAYPDLSPEPSEDEPDKVLSGAASAIATGVRAFAEAGVGHAICAVEPATPEALERFAEALTLYRAG
ncbi:MAG TPA: LLM class flavin-dependent oxidoreductase [Thermomicrobiales bacterium]|nr:LLM class flavin-dependent oxidoreductase [Thermomicrobiales bacterium]